MGVTLRKDGRYRAYKKIRGVEHQFYFEDEVAADQKQSELEALSKLKPKKVFSDCGRLIGYRIRLDIRAGRRPRIVARKALGPYHQQDCAWFYYHDHFEQFWAQTKSDWISSHALLPIDVLSYKNELLIAKRLYMQDLARAKDQLRQIHDQSAQ